MTDSHGTGSLSASEGIKRTRAYDVSKHLTIQQAVQVCRIARDAVEDWDAMRDSPTEANVNSFKADMEKLRKIVEP